MKGQDRQWLSPESCSLLLVLSADGCGNGCCCTQVAPRPLAGCAPLDAGAAAGLDPLDWRSSVGAVGTGDLKQARAQEGLAMLRRGSRDGLGLADGRPAAAQQQLEQHADPGIGACLAFAADITPKMYLLQFTGAGRAEHNTFLTPDSWPRVIWRHFP